LIEIKNGFLPRKIKTPKMGPGRVDRRVRYPPRPATDFLLLPPLLLVFDRE
jgi:hypothetical protein